MLRAHDRLCAVKMRDIMSQLRAGQRSLRAWQRGKQRCRRARITNFERLVFETVVRMPC